MVSGSASLFAIFLLPFLLFEILSEPPAVAGGPIEWNAEFGMRIQERCHFLNRHSEFRNHSARPLPQAVLTNL